MLPDLALLWIGKDNNHSKRIVPLPKVILGKDNINYLTHIINLSKKAQSYDSNVYLYVYNISDYQYKLTEKLLTGTNVTLKKFNIDRDNIKPKYSNEKDNLSLEEKQDMFADMIDVGKLIVAQDRLNSSNKPIMVVDFDIDIIFPMKIISSDAKLGLAFGKTEYSKENETDLEISSVLFNDKTICDELLLECIKLSQNKTEPRGEVFFAIVNYFNKLPENNKVFLRDGEDIKISSHKTWHEDNSIQKPILSFLRENQMKEEIRKHVKRFNQL